MLCVAQSVVHAPYQPHDAMQATPAISSARMRVRTLRRLLHAGPEAWWAMALDLDGPCRWDERSQAPSATRLPRACHAPRT